jgi:hypothetical protein
VNAFALVERELHPISHGVPCAHPQILASRGPVR